MAIRLLWSGLWAFLARVLVDDLLVSLSVLLETPELSETGPDEDLFLLLKVRLELTPGTGLDDLLLPCLTSTDPERPERLERPERTLRTTEISLTGLDEVLCPPMTMSSERAEEWSSESDDLDRRTPRTIAISPTGSDEDPPRARLFCPSSGSEHHDPLERSDLLLEPTRSTLGEVMPSPLDPVRP